jgi:hypothetical protein
MEVNKKSFEGVKRLIKESICLTKEGVRFTLYFFRVEKKSAKNETTKCLPIDLHLTQPNYPTLGLS